MFVHAFLKAKNLKDLFEVADSWKEYGRKEKISRDVGIILITRNDLNLYGLASLYESVYPYFT